VKKLLSLELTWCYFNEWKEIPRAIFEVMDTRVGRYPRADDVPHYWTGIWGDTNPFDDDHWMFHTFEELRPEGFEIFKQPSGRSRQAENRTHLKKCPLATAHPTYERDSRGEYVRVEEDTGEHLSPCMCYYEKVARGKGLNFIKVMVDGEYGSYEEGKVVFPEFADSVHVPAQPIPTLQGCHLLVGADFGLTPAAVFIQRDPSDGQLQVIREFVSQRMGALGFGTELRRICKTEFPTNTFQGFGDPAGVAGSSVDEQETPINIVDATGVPMVAAHTNDFTIRCDTVRRLLTTMTWRARPALVISSKCRTLRKALASKYCLKRLQVTGEERFQDRPIKNEWSHAAEALQYGLLGAGEDAATLDGGQGRKNRESIRVIRSSGPPRTFRVRR
jgi:hypothetical protein